jgi:hypothetical protein
VLLQRTHQFDQLYREADIPRVRHSIHLTGRRTASSATSSKPCGGRTTSCRIEMCTGEDILDI